MTNREFIESKTDEDLADFYYELVNACLKLGFYNYKIDRDEILNFLQSEVEQRFIDMED